MNRYRIFLLQLNIALLLLISGKIAYATNPEYVADPRLDPLFADAQKIDLATSSYASVVKLRDDVGIPPPPQIVLLKIFDPERIPFQLAPYLSSKNIAGVTISGKYVAVKQSEFKAFTNDTIMHELVHAYITLASPKQLPYWFQEGSAVYFSTNKAWKFYGKPSEEKIGQMDGTVVRVADDYEQKLGNFHYLIEKVGKERFYKWYKAAVMTGIIDARALIREKIKVEDVKVNRTIPGWVYIVGVVAGVVVVAAGIIAGFRGGHYE